MCNEDTQILTKCYLFFASCFMIVMLILSIIYNLSNSMGTQLFDYPLNNWKSEIISDMVVVLSSDKCPQSYSAESIFHYTWPGTSNGCSCLTGDELRLGTCCIPSSRETCLPDGFNCSGNQISFQGSISGDFWDVDGLPYTICV